MKKIDLGQAINTLANLGVIAGIVFLAVEIRQNNELLAADASFNRFSIERTRRERIMENRGGLAEVVLKTNKNIPLNDLEALQTTAHMLDLLESLKWYFGEVVAGRLEAGSIDIANWQLIWRVNPPLRELFVDRRASLDPAFVEFVEREIAVEQTD